MIFCYNPFRMKIGILSRNRHLYSTRRLLEASRSLGHEPTVVDTLAVAVEIRGNDDDKIRLIRHRPASVSAAVWGLSSQAAVFLPHFDAIIPRIGATVTEYGVAVVRQFEMRRILTTATAEGIASSRDKLHSLQLMSRLGLPTPRTAVVSQHDSLGVAIRAVGGLPVILKVIQGTQGRGVILVRNMATAEAVLERLRSARQRLLVQEFLAEASGRDVRVIVVDDRCVAAMERRAAHDDFRANLHLGGTAVPFQLDAATTMLAIRAAQAHGLRVAGVDIITSNRGNLVLEVNSSPGLEGIERVTSVDVATEIVRFLEKEHRQHAAGAV